MTTLVAIIALILALSGLKVQEFSILIFSK